MEQRTRWMGVALLALLAVAGFLGWRGMAWRTDYYAHAIGQLTYQVGMARRELLQARDSRIYQQKVDAMATAHGYLVSAHAGATPALERLAPFRKGRPAYMPGMYVPMLLQYARDLTPDMESQALQKRIDLLEGLEQALQAGQTEGRVHVARLKASLEAYFDAMPRPEGALLLRFADEPNRPDLSAVWHGSEVTLRVDWSRTFRVFPHFAASRLLLIRPAADVRSDAGQQERMGEGALAPFTMEAAMHEVIKQQLPEGWGPGEYVAVRIPEGLPQTLTLRFSGAATPSLLLVELGAQAPAVAIPIGEP